MKNQYAIFFILAFGFMACDNDADPNPESKLRYSSESFLPMEIGNYWKINKDNYIEITDTLRIDGDLFYKFYSLTGGDAVGRQYLRIDSENNLIEKSPMYPSWEYVHAKFNLTMGEKFYTLGDSSVNDYEVTVDFKDEAIMNFSFDAIYHPHLRGHAHIVSYEKGLGYVSHWKEVSISGTIYNF